MIAAELEAQVVQATDSREKVNLLNRLGYEVRNTNIARSTEASREALRISEALGYAKGRADALCNIGFAELQFSGHETAMRCLSEALELYESLNDETGCANVRYNLGLVHMRMGNYDSSIAELHKSLAWREKTGDLSGQALCYFQLSFIHENFDEDDTGLELAKRSYAIRQQLNDRIGCASSLMQLGNFYIRSKDYENARRALEESMRLRSAKDDIRGYFATLLHWTQLHMELGDYGSASASAREGLAISRAANEIMGMMRFLQINGRVALAQGQQDEAFRHYSEAAELAAAKNFKSLQFASHQALSDLYAAKGDYRQALEHFRKFHAIKEEVLNSQSAVRLRSVQLIGQIDSAKREAELERTKNAIIEERNKSITDSITYAQRIQRALLASGALLDSNLPEYFVLYKPKDIVSGDFYWAAKVGGPGSERFLLAVCDCTGHGVPGAFMSLLNISFLNEIVSGKDISRPDLVLNEVRTSIIGALQAEEDSKDGMDGVLCAFDFSSRTIEIACANNPAWLIRNGSVSEFTPDKMPVGLHHGELRPFTLHTAALQPGDCIYLFSDGFSDQFGGPKSKKLKRRQLQAKLLELSALPMREQKEKLEHFFETWRGELEQVDDVLVIGVRA